MRDLAALMVSRLPNSYLVAIPFSLFLFPFVDIDRMCALKPTINKIGSHQLSAFDHECYCSVTYLYYV